MRRAGPGTQASVVSAVAPHLSSHVCGRPSPTCAHERTAGQRQGDTCESAVHRRTRRRESLGTDKLEMEQLAALVRAALASADVDAYRELLDPLVRWGPPDDETSGCHNREEVLEWYRLARDHGLRADVAETVVRGDKILVGLDIRQPGVTSGGEERRWQLLRVENSKITDIRGFDDRGEAVRRMG